MSAFPCIEVEAPTRIDLAGGTLDLYPLYLFEGGGLTLNAAISVMSRATVEPRDDGAIVLRSLDMDCEESFAGPDALAFDGPLALLARAVGHYAPPCGVTVTAHNEAPHGSGLGGSSALLMALSVALARLRGDGADFTSLIDVGANLEAQVLGIPTGKQDYYPALYGGVSCLRFHVAGHERLELCASEAARRHLEDHLVLSFTGVPHASGATNWEMLRGYIEAHGGTRAALGRIRETAHAMHACLAAEEWDRLADLLAEEWHNRRRLGPGVSTPQVDAAMAAAEAAGARASKLCGAGGGGCMVTYAAPADRAAVETALTGAGARVLPYRIVADGVRVRERAMN